MSNGTVYDDLDGNGCPAVDEANNNKKPDLTVGVGWDAARLLMLGGISETLSSPHHLATVVSGGVQGAGSVLASLPTAIAQCATGNCNQSDIAMAMIPGIPGVHVPGTGVGRFVKNQKLRNILRDFNRTGQGIGTGSTADAIRHELQTGSSVGGKLHYTKGMEQFRGLLKLWRDPNLDPADRAVVRDLLSALEKALVR